MKKRFYSVVGRYHQKKEQIEATIETLIAEGKRYGLSQLNILLAHRFSRENQAVADIAKILSRVRIVLVEYAPLLDRIHLEVLKDQLREFDQRFAKIIVRMGATSSKGEESDREPDKRILIMEDLRVMLDDVKKFDETVPQTNALIAKVALMIDKLAQKIAEATSKIEALRSFDVDVSSQGSFIQTLTSGWESACIYAKSRRFELFVQAFEDVQRNVTNLQEQIRSKERFRRLSLQMLELERMLPPNRSTVCKEAGDLIDEIRQTYGDTSVEFARNYIGYIKNELCRASSAHFIAQDCIDKQEWDKAERHLRNGRESLILARAFIAKLIEAKRVLDSAKERAEVLAEQYHETAGDSTATDEVVS
jgi:hypothetical protein